MDPDQTLNDIYDAIEDVDNAESSVQAAMAGETLAGLVTALDGWIRSGGALPATWRRQASNNG